MSLLTTKEISTQLKVSDRTVRNWIETGVLKAYRFGNQYRIDTVDFEKFKAQSIINNQNFKEE